MLKRREWRKLTEACTRLSRALGIKSAFAVTPLPVTYAPRPPSSATAMPATSPPSCDNSAASALTAPISTKTFAVNKNRPTAAPRARREPIPARTPVSIRRLNRWASHHQSGSERNAKAGEANTIEGYSFGSQYGCVSPRFLRIKHELLYNDAE